MNFTQCNLDMNFTQCVVSIHGMIAIVAGFSRSAAALRCCMEPKHQVFSKNTHPIFMMVFQSSASIQNENQLLANMAYKDKTVSAGWQDVYV